MNKWIDERELLFPFLLGEGIDPDSKKARDKIHQENHNVADRVKKIAKIMEWEIEHQRLPVIVLQPI